MYNPLLKIKKRSGVKKKTLRMPGGIFHIFDQWTKPIVDDRVVPAIKDAASSASTFLNHGVDATETGLKQLESSIAQSGLGKFVSHTVENMKGFTRDVREGFLAAATEAKDFAKHTIHAAEAVEDGIGTTAKSLSGMMEYIVPIAGVAVAAYAFSTLSSGQKRRRLY